MNNKVLVVANMYPSKSFPSYGVFVKNFCEQLMDLGIKTEKSVLTKSKNSIQKIVKYMLFYISSFLKCVFGVDS